MNVGKIVANTSAILATAALALESNQMGVRKAVENSKNQGAKDSIRDVIGTSKLNYSSPLYNESKQEIFKLKTPNMFKDIYHGIAGYIKGFANGIAHNWTTAGFAALTLISKKPKMKAFGAIGLGVSVAWNFIKNGTSIFEKRSYLD